MSRAGRVRRAGLALSALALTSCAGGIGPRLDTASPEAAGRNASVTLTGRGLCGGVDCASAAGEIQIGLGSQPVRASVIRYDDTGATIVIPSVTPVGKTELVVTVNDRSSNALAFEVLP